MLLDQPSGIVDGNRCKVGRIGTHVRDVPVLIQALSHLHGSSGGKVQLAIGLLLQSTGGEGWIGPRGVRLVLDFGHTEFAILNSLDDLLRFSVIEQHQFFILKLASCRIKIFTNRDSTTVNRNQGSLELLATLFGKLAQQIPPGGRDKLHSFAFALDDESYSHTLHAASREFRPHLLPQQRRYLITIQAVNDSPRLLSPHKTIVNFAR